MKKIKLSIFQIIILVLTVIALALWASIIFTEPSAGMLGIGETTPKHSKYSIIV